MNFPLLHRYVSYYQKHIESKHTPSSPHCHLRSPMKKNKEEHKPCPTISLTSSPAHFYPILYFMLASLIPVIHAPPIPGTDPWLPGCFPPFFNLDPMTDSVATPLGGPAALTTSSAAPSAGHPSLSWTYAASSSSCCSHNW